MATTIEDLKKMNRDDLVQHAAGFGILVKEEDTKEMIRNAILTEMSTVNPSRNADNSARPNAQDAKRDDETSAGQNVGGDGEDDETEAPDGGIPDEEDKGDSMRPTPKEVADPTEGYLKIGEVATMLDEFYAFIKDGDSRKKLNELKQRLIGQNCFMRHGERMEQIQIRDPNDARVEELYAIVFSLMKRYCGEHVEIMSNELELAKATDAELLAKWKNNRTVLEINIQ